jgi:peptidoglycan/LPS O-acetylase OafA/YrhL
VDLFYVYYLKQHGFILTRILIMPMLAFVISYGLAKLSFRYFETPFLKLKLKQSIIQTSDKKLVP